jgi:membrane-bound serine protease (ClpP class)
LRFDLAGACHTIGAPGHPEPGMHRRPRSPTETVTVKYPLIRTRLFGAVLVAVLAASALAQSPPVRAPVAAADIDGAIGPATTDYVRRVIDDAASRGAACLVLRMDTPGGLSAAMRDIIQAILASPVPVVVYVSPGGAHAASAGAVIALAAHISAMAPGTNIGAAHPVAIGGAADTSDVMTSKITNDAAAYARSLASRRGRNVEWAERVVRESISSTAEEAVAEGVVDLVASDMAQLLEEIDGRVIEVPGGTVTLHTAGASVVDLPPTFRERFLSRISDPNIAYILMLIGVFGLFFELQNPGAVLPGVAGAVAIIMAAFGLQMLPVNWTGVALIALGIVLFILEVKITSHGALTIGGIAAMFVGSIMLIDSPLPFMRVSLAVIIPSVLFTALFFLFAVGMGIRAQRRKVTTGNEGLLGERGVARTDVHEGGSVFVHGEHWNARSEAPIAAGTRVVVEHVDGMTVTVRPVNR